MADDEIHSVFPDPTGEQHPDRQRPPATMREVIDHAIRDIKFNATWDPREDGLYCLICAPGGYRIRENANPQMHEEQRNPDTHRRNLVWATIKWFEAQKLPMPSWPDCYEDHHGVMWCMICRHVVGAYTQEDGERHDATHRSLQRVVMRPERFRPKVKAKRRDILPKRRHMIDEILAAREAGYDAPAEAAAARGQFGDPAPDPNRAPEIAGSFTARPGSSWQERLGYNTMDQSVPINSRPALNNKTGQWEQVTREKLDEWVEVQDPVRGVTVRWRRACEDYDFCETRGVRDPCSGQGCECNCHVNADSPGTPEVSA